MNFLRTDILEEIAAKGREMREAQVAYFISRKGGGRYPSQESRNLLKHSKVLEVEFDGLLTKLNDEED